MGSIVLYINGVMTLSENAFNVLGYLPKQRFKAINEWSTAYRFRFGAIQMIAGAALCALSFYFSSEKSVQKYLTFGEQMFSLGILYGNHGLYNIVRSYAEHFELGPILSPYDFYGRKILPPLAPAFDLQGQLFERMRRQLDRIHTITVFPMKFSLRA